MSAYYIHWTGVQQSIEVPINNIPTGVITNAGSASGPGVEFTLAARPFEGLALNTTFSWNNLKFDDAVYSGGLLIFAPGNRLNISPEFTASGSVSYTFPLGGSGVKGQFLASENYTSVLDNVYVLDQTAANGGPQPSNLPSNSMLIARAQFAVMPSAHWTIALLGDNLAGYNGSLQTFANPIYDKRTTPRTVGLRVDYHLK